MHLAVAADNFSEPLLQQSVVSLNEHDHAIAFSVREIFILPSQQIPLKLKEEHPRVAQSPIA